MSRLAYLVHAPRMAASLIWALWNTSGSSAVSQVVWSERTPNPTGNAVIARWLNILAFDPPPEVSSTGLSPMLGMVATMGSVRLIW